MSALHRPRGGGGRSRAVRGRGTPAPRGRGQAEAKLPARSCGQAVTISPTTTKSAPMVRRPPSQNGAPNISRKSSPSGTHQSRSGMLTHASRESVAPPFQEVRPVSGLENGSLPLQKRMGDLYQKLKKDRDYERKDAIKNGFLADPDKPTSLANAITPVGTCEDMCPHFERVERIVQLMVDNSEKRTLSSGTREPDESKMVKRFRRSAAGYDEQLPSDIRPPRVLQKTLDYLINEVVGGQQPLASVHKFVWDRTRGIRNDFSIQQVTKLEDLRIAINCFERVARFHILSLHQLSRPDGDIGEFDHHQEREQLNNTLLSLMYYYDDSRHKLTSPNEAEFRAYCIVFEIQDQRPDLEDRAQQWPRPLLQDPRVQVAFKLYATAGNTSDEQGPLRPRAAFAIAQTSIGRFWDIVSSSTVSYTMACVTEIYFELVRKTALETMWKAYRGKRGGAARIEDWGLEQLTLILGFDDQQQTQTYVEEHGFSVAEREDGVPYIDLGSVTSKHLPDSHPRRKQLFSRNLVERKRLNRTLPAIINGFSASEARSQGLIEDASDLDEPATSHYEPLFVTEGSNEEPEKPPRFSSGNTTKALKKTPSNPTLLNMTTLNKGSTVSSDKVETNPFSSLKPTSVDQSPTSKLRSDRESPFPHTSSFGKPSFLPIISPLLSPTIAPSGEMSEQQPKVQESSFTKNTTLDRKKDQLEAGNPSSSGGAIPSFESFALPRNTTRSTFGDTESFLKEGSTEKAVKPDVEKGTGGPPETHSHEEAAEKIVQQPDRLFPPIPFTIKPDERDLWSTPSELPSTLKGPKSTKGSSSTGDTSLSLQDFSQLPISLPSDQRLSATETNTANPFNITPQQTSSTSTATSPYPSFPSTANIGAHIVGKLRTRSQPFFLTGPSKPSNTTSPVENGHAVQTDLEAGSRTRTINSNQRSIVLNALSAAIMQGDDGLLQQFIEYMVGPIIVKSIQEMKAERSWMKARLCRVLLISRKYGRIWKKNAWKLGLLRKGKERRKIFAKSMYDSTRNIDQRHSVPRPLVRRAEDTKPSLLNGTPSNTPSNDSPSRRPSLPGDLADVRLRERGLEVSSNKRKRHDSPNHMPVHLSENSEPHHKRSSTLTTHARSQASHRLQRHPNDSKITSGDPQEKKSSQDHNIKRARALISGRSDTTRTDYFRLKALGVDPDTPVVPRTMERRSSADASSIDKERTDPSQSFPYADRSHLGRKVQISGDTSPMGSQQLQTTIEGDEDSDEALLAQMRSVCNTMSDSISWFREERAKSQLASSSGEERASNETVKQKRLREFTTTPSRTEQRLRRTGAHGLLPRRWNPQSSWRDASGRISTLPAAASQLYRSHAASSASNLAAPCMETKRLMGMGTMKATAVEAPAGSSVEDAIEL